jgi:hypothetical protein
MESRSLRTDKKFYSISVEPQNCAFCCRISLPGADLGDAARHEPSTNGIELVGILRSIRIGPHVVRLIAKTHEDIAE